MRSDFGRAASSESFTGPNLRGEWEAVTLRTGVCPNLKGDPAAPPQKKGGEAPRKASPRAAAAPGASEDRVRHLERKEKGRLPREPSPPPAKRAAKANPGHESFWARVQDAGQGEPDGFFQKFRAASRPCNAGKPALRPVFSRRNGRGPHAEAPGRPPCAPGGANSGAALRLSNPQRRGAFGGFLECRKVRPAADALRDAQKKGPAPEGVGPKAIGAPGELRPAAAPGRTAPAVRPGASGDGRVCRAERRAVRRRTGSPRFAGTQRPAR